MDKDDNVYVYDATVDLTDTWTSLVTRTLGERLVASLTERLSNIPPKSVLALDFLAVTNIDPSFLDEFLVRILRDIQKGKFGERMIAGINLDSNRIATEGVIESGLAKAGTPFIALDSSGNPRWFGLTGNQERAVLEAIYQQSETIEHLQVRFHLNLAEVWDIVVSLETKGLIKRAYDHSIEVEHLLPSVDLDSLRSRAKIFMSEFEQLVTRSVEKGWHYELSPAVHVAEYLHLSKVFSNVRIAAKVALIASRFYGQEGKRPDLVLTVGTPAALAFGQRLAGYLGARFIFACVDENFRAVLAPGLHGDRGQKVLVSIDVLSTGMDVKALLELARVCGWEAIGICTAVDVSGGTIAFPPLEITRTLTINLERYGARECLLCKNDVPLKRPTARDRELYR